MPRVGGELRGLAMEDLRRSSLLAFLLVAAVVVVSVGGRLGDSLLSGVPLALGCLWTFGLWGAFGGHIDVLAISTLPVLFGTGIDLGVHAVHGGRLRPEEGIRGTVESSGLAMLLITLTTGVGFGSLGGVAGAGSAERGHAGCGRGHGVPGGDVSGASGSGGLVPEGSCERHCEEQLQRIAVAV